LGFRLALTRTRVFFFFFFPEENQVCNFQVNVPKQSQGRLLQKNIKLFTDETQGDM